jgi:hypothetical protein
MFAISYKRLTFAANKMQQSCQEMNNRELLEYLTFAEALLRTARNPQQKG